MSTQPIAHLTVEQYLEIERAAEFRSEYIDGQVYAMAGGGLNQALIAMAVVARLDEQLRGRPCAVAGSDLRLFLRVGQDADLSRRRRLLQTAQVPGRPKGHAHGRHRHH